MSLLDSISSSTDRASDDNSGNGSSGKGSKSGNDSSDKDSNSGKHNNKSNNKDNSRDDNNDNNDKKSKPSKSKSNSDDDGLDSMTSKSKSISANVTATSGDQPSGDSSSSSNDVAAMVGILVGVAVLIIVIVAIIVVCVKRRKKKKKPQEAQQYYNNDPKGQYNPNWYNNNNHPMSNASSGVMPPQGGWQMPPPPPGMMSSDMSGGYSSGPMGPPTPPPHPGISLGFNKSTFSYEELAAATQGFSQANVLGQGGFGFVHKGVFPNGKEVAVKSLKSGSGQGEREFQAEVEIISRVHHRHLVSLVGYCISGGQRMLVYEFVPNGTLEYHLHGKGRPVMKFESRIKIALGSAKGLAYLHEDCHPRIIHRDIKTANILIDDTFEAKVADFGLAKLSSDNYTHVSTRVMGTFGYLAPEYAASGKLTDKSDVFSFGVMLLELVTGRRPINPTGDEDSLVDWARPQLMRTLDEERFEGLVDPKLENNFNPSEMTRMAACAAAAIRHSSKRRPRMSQIVRALEGDMPLDALNGDGAVKPGQSTNFGTGDSTSYDANSYQKDMKKFMMTLNEEDYTSSEYESSQEYGRGSGNGFSSESRGGGGRNKSFM